MVGVLHRQVLAGRAYGQIMVRAYSGFAVMLMTLFPGVERPARSPDRREASRPPPGFAGDTATSGCAKHPELCRPAPSGEESVLCPPLCRTPVPPNPSKPPEAETATRKDDSPKKEGSREAAPKKEKASATPMPIALPEDGECLLVTQGGKATQEDPRWCLYMCDGFPTPIIITLDVAQSRCPGGKNGAKVTWSNIRGYRRLRP